MGRRRFLADLADASSSKTPNIEGVHTPDEGVVSCMYTCNENRVWRYVNINFCATNLDEYPDGNSFMLYTDDEHIDPSIPQTLEAVGADAHGKSLSEVLSEVSQRLSATLSDDGENNTDTVLEDGDEDDFDFEYDSDGGDFGLADLQPITNVARENGSSRATTQCTNPPSLQKIRADLRALKDAGFRVGIFGNLATTGALCVSVRVVKLGLSDEAMQAWSLRRQHYLILLIRYSGAYMDASRLCSEVNSLNGKMEMRVGLCQHYKPSSRDVLSTFEKKGEAVSTEAEASTFEPLFIGQPLNQFLAERLLYIIKARHSHGLSWLGAEKFVEARQLLTSNSNFDDLVDYQCDDNANTTNLPGFVMADHMGQISLEKASLPLIAMQAVLRHFVRCTEFCLVCHSHVDNSFEALKPYVCTKPLCLYQYMTLGFGPSLEWDVCSQPYVVDLLISFCHVAGNSGRLKDYPVGLNLMTPVLPHYSVPFPDPTVYYLHNANKGSTSTPMSAEKTFSCMWHANERQLRKCQNEDWSLAKLRVGDWLVTVAHKNQTAAHHRIKNISMDVVELGEPVFVVFNENNQTSGQSQSTTQDIAPPLDGSVKADCFLYDKNFDVLPVVQKQRALVALLDTLPSVEEMCEYLERQGRGRAGSLKLWKDRISDPALNLLRWIIASNRSCIVQVGEVVGDQDGKALTATEDRVEGMDGYMQFRFAQGAPDKEKRFNDCVKTEAVTTGTQYPTLFAWHGSQLWNWHSIIRQGLRFDEIVHGRAYGNGVYMSRHAATSLGYSNNNLVSDWKPSMLQIGRAFSLNEVVNHPARFVSRSPHYVVSDLDWIQTRYLFVKVNKAFTFKEGKCTEMYKQDPLHVASNELNRAIIIPMTAISKSRRPCNTIDKAATEAGKRTKTLADTDQATAEHREDDANSVMSDATDVAYLDGNSEVNRGGSGHTNPGEDDMGMTLIHGRKRPVDAVAETDFVAGTLDVSSIKFLNAPQNATPTATKALMRLLQEAISVQENTAPAILGWYINRDMINNIYQWIVELHSFAAELPLTADMKAAGVKSIVLEMRFSTVFPFSPPFIRVVKPRFLPFAQGGGGNVTEGGAMCMEVLTNDGWTAAQNVESLLLQVRMAICDEERPARLAPPRAPGLRQQNTYGIGEARSAYIRACQNHGWTVPAGFDKIQQE
ncbi:ubiquitin-conjugating enzyme E2 Q [Exophiala viscosa]|uniref:ubiquitin-conjugating enzyme E2 Q n=1 Tax=Exophiala viscosa TaxID=2486360 RepID=UPI0021971BC9|nr:ubiquitin-conjugating enzyme E2 Q [Exophiala viscosa]